jgi:nucleoside-diphosphate-sugar epimerase
MRVLVTGGSGRLGQFAIAELLNHGHEAVIADRVAPTNPRAPKEAREVRYIQTDLSDVGQVAGAMTGCDAVIHLGAIAAPYHHADEVVFKNNVLSTFSVLQAASLLGVKKAVFASSISALGTAYAPVPFAPAYAPVDEEIPLLNHDCYGLSKEVDEHTGHMFVRRFGMQVLALRFHWVAYEEEVPPRAQEVAADPMFDNWWRLLWGWVDVRDAAQMCRLSVEADGLGSEAFNCTAADTIADIPTEELIRTYAPQVELRAPIEGFGSAFSLEKARRLLGYDPKHTWRA